MLWCTLSQKLRFKLIIDYFIWKWKNSASDLFISIRTKLEWVGIPAFTTKYIYGWTMVYRYAKFCFPNQNFKVCFWMKHNHFSRLLPHSLKMHPFNTTSPFRQIPSKRKIRDSSWSLQFFLIYVLYTGQWSHMWNCYVICIEISLQCSIIWFCLDHHQVYSTLFQSSKGKENTKGTIEYFNLTKSKKENKERK
jgi:hypothetical protein